MYICINKLARGGKQQNNNYNKRQQTQLSNQVDKFTGVWGSTTVSSHKVDSNLSK